MRFVYGVLVRALRLGIILAASVLPCSLAQAQAVVAGTIEGKPDNGFGRIVLKFAEPVSAVVRMAGGVMILTFDREVRINPDKLPAALQGYISAVRLDPDQRSIRFALARPLRADLKDAAERLFLDLMPDEWRGAAPSLPPDVVQELARRARAMNTALREAETRTMKPAAKLGIVRIAENAQRIRLSIDLPAGSSGALAHQGKEATVTLTGPVTLDEAAVHSTLAGSVERLSVAVAEGRSELSFTAPVEDFSFDTEGDTFIVDMLRKPAKPLEPAVVAAAKPVIVEQRHELPAVTAGSSQAQASAAPQAPAMQPAGSAAAINSAASLAKLPESSGIGQVSFESRGDSVRLVFSPKVPLAVFEQSSEVWVVLQGPRTLRVPALDKAASMFLKSVVAEPLEGAVLVRIRPERQELVSVAEDPASWIVTIGARLEGPVEQIRFQRLNGVDGRKLVQGRLPQAGTPLEIRSSESEQAFTVVPLVGAPHAVLNGQNFVEFQLLRTAHGLVVHPRADDLFVRADLDTVVIGRDAGLSLSPDKANQLAGDKLHRDLTISAERWQADRRGAIRQTERDFLKAAADSSKRDRTAARLRLAEFYLANGFGHEAEGVLALTSLDDPVAALSKQVALLKLVSLVQSGDFNGARRAASHPSLALENEAGLWRAFLDVEARKYGPALTAFRQFADVLETYPENLQALFRPSVVEAAIEGGDTYLANQQLGEIERLDSDERDPGLVPLLQGRIAEASGQPTDALKSYRLAANSGKRPIEADARLRQVLLQLKENKVSRDAAQAELETISMIWRKSEIEVRALAKLGEIYAADSHWRDAFNMTKRAVEILPEHPVTRKLQDDTAQRFEDLFLGGKANGLSRIEALGIFEEFRSLIPIGPRGDEIVRRLAERLYDLDLLDQATELLAHQVNHRLKGPARAQVATRLAVVHLVNRKPQEALQVLKASRLSSLPPELRRARVMLEARTLAELSRTELAMEVLAAETGSDIERLRADILWRGKRWLQAAEAYERGLGDRWQQDEPLSDGERGDVVRAAVAYVLATDRLGADRLRAKYLPKMSNSADADTFKLVTLDNLSRTQDFREIARSVVSSETLSDFLEAYRKRYPVEAGGQRGAKPQTSG